MITITRSTARHVRAVFRKALSVAARGRIAVVLIEAGANGLVFKTKYNDVAVEYRMPGQYPEEAFAFDMDLLQDCEGAKHDLVRIQQGGKGMIEAQWQHGAIPQSKRYDARVPDDVLKGFPVSPAEMLENPPQLLTALRDASETAEPNPLRYATNMIRLCSEAGSVGATDGRQLLVQRGFALPCKCELLFPSNKVFGAKELAQTETVYIGRTEDCVSLAVGDWTFHFTIDKVGRFPKLEDHIQTAGVTKATLSLSETDAAFLAQALDRLPCDDEIHLPVTLDINGQVIVRAKAAEQARVTELVLPGSKCSGTAVAINTNRKYLARALRIGFREFLVFAKDRPMQCQDEQRSYVWAVLDPEGVIKAGKDPIRIDSPSQEAVKTPQPKQQRKEAMPRRKGSDYAIVPANGTTNGAENGNANGYTNGAANGTTNAEHAGEVSLIEQAEAVRTSLKESTDKVSDLITSLKRHRKQSRLVQSTLSSLKQLQSLDA